MLAPSIRVLARSVRVLARRSSVLARSLHVLARRSSVLALSLHVLARRSSVLARSFHVLARRSSVLALRPFAGCRSLQVSHIGTFVALKRAFACLYEQSMRASIAGGVIHSTDYFSSRDQWPGGW